MAHSSVTDDYLSEAGAHALARKIREYWYQRGVVVDVRVEMGAYERSGARGPSFWVVRSNIDVCVLR